MSKRKFHKLSPKIPDSIGENYIVCNGKKIKVAACASENLKKQILEWQQGKARGKKRVPVVKKQGKTNKLGNISTFFDGIEI